MTWDDESKVVGRAPYERVDIFPDKCQLSYGRTNTFGTCTAQAALENLLLRASQFENAAWSKQQLTVSANAVKAPDGTTTADALIPDASNTVHDVFQRLLVADFKPGATVYTASVFLLRGGYTAAQLIFENNGVQARLNVDLENGALLWGAEQGIQFGITGDSDWWRIFFTVELASAANDIDFYVRPMEEFGGNPIFVGDNVKQIYAWGAQLVAGDNLGQFFETGATRKVATLPLDTGLCYNTFATCQDKPSYDRNFNQLRFQSKSREYSPDQLEFGLSCLKGISYAPTRLDPGRGLGARASVSVTLEDFELEDDVRTDPYIDTRRFTIKDQGTFFGKFKARNPFYQGRTLRIDEAYDATFGVLPTITRSRYYVIDAFTGPDTKGRVQITAKDILDLSKNSKAQAPEPIDTDVVLSVDPGSGGTTLTFADAATAQKLTTDGTTPIDSYVTIEDEIILLGSISGATWTGCTRGEAGTDEKAHAVGSTVQPCFSVSNRSIALVLQDLLEQFANVPSTYITIADWNQEKTDHLSGFDLTAIIPAPTGVAKLITELTQLSLSDMWWDELAQQIRWKVQSPYQNPNPPLLTDAENFLQDTLKVKDVQAKRVTRVLTYYGIVNSVKDFTEPDNFSKANFDIQANKESVNEYNQRQLQRIFNRWLPASKTQEVALTNNRIISRYSDTPIEVHFKLDARDAEEIKTGDVFDIETRLIQGITGLPSRTRLQVIESRPDKSGSWYMYKAFAFFQDPLEQGPITINTNQTDYNLFVELGGPSSAVGTVDNPQEVIIDPGVIIDATQGNVAFDLGDLPSGSFIKITNNGTIRGHGGPGGAGGQAILDRAYDFEFLRCEGFGGQQDGFDGLPGGDAVAVRGTGQVLEIDNTSGNIFGGGGGGGGSGGSFNSLTAAANGGAGGGGGIGSDTADGGAGGPGIMTTQDATRCPVTGGVNGNPGVDGSAVANGAGGAGTGGAFPTGNGGAGGTDYGLDGSPGLIAGLSASPGAGGAAGFAVRKNGNVVTITAGFNATQVKGQVA